MTRVAIVATEGVLDLDTDGAFLFPALAAAGLEAEAVSWRDAAVAWETYDLSVIRATWDYIRHYEEFCAWLERVAGCTRLLNPLEVIRWNTDKVYLAELEAAGIPVVPTRFLAPGARDWELLATPVVVKPTISAGCNDTARYDPGQESAARAHAERLLAAGQGVMLQPYQGAVDEAGESGLVYLEGEFSHAFRKGPLLREGKPQNPVAQASGLFQAESITPREPSPQELALGARVIAWVEARFGRLLYARVDLVPGPAGAPCLMELELTEPSLFHEVSPPSATRLAEAIAVRARGRALGVDP